MQMIPSTSSMFSEYGWEAGTLGVRYRSGGKLFHHEGAPEAVYDMMRAAESDPDASVGKIFHREVKKQYPGVEIKEAPEDLPVAPIGGEDGRQ